MYPYEESDGRGEGVLTGGSACLIFWPWCGRLFGGGLLLELRALIRGNTVSNLMFEERAKPSCKKTAMREIRTMFLSVLIISPRFASARANYSRRLLFTDL